MKEHKILITGTSGQVGFELQQHLSCFGELLCPNRDELNLQNLEQVDKYLKETRPTLIINPAAWTAVDKAEERKEDAFSLNSKLPELFASYASKNDCWLIHYSTDYVYPGDGETPWHENSATQPLSVYGVSKLKGDHAVLNSNAKHLIFRTSWVYSYRGNNFLNTMLKLAAERKQLSIVSDQIGTPTSATLIANITQLAVFRIINEDPIESGVYHLTPRGYISWYEFAKCIFEIQKQGGNPLKIEAVTPILSKDYPTPAARPLNSRLNNSKLEKALKIKFPTWKQDLNNVIKRRNGL